METALRIALNYYLESWECKDESKALELMKKAWLNFLSDEEGQDFLEEQGFHIVFREDRFQDMRVIVEIMQLYYEASSEIIKHGN